MDSYAFGEPLPSLHSGGFMKKVFASDLAGKEIVTVDGIVLGELENITFNADTGELVDLVVKPDRNLSRVRYRADGKFVRIPFSAVCAIKDYIVVDEGKSILSRGQGRD
ncbi:PRC-barrel domain protein [Methanothrix thermoacetophila PT]|uniref:PRC-barrel domain protein n=2 Tax=Methanotrichaceae TaxID=143067 RepID=A0B5A4_METTP|nr:PRC-barrel domain protein [Methanothrix thermoacetophila PT]